MRGMRYCITVIFCALAAINCNSIPTKTFNDKAILAAEAAERFVAAGKMPEAQAMIYQLQYLHPDDPAVRRLQDKLPIDYRADLESKKWLGVNMVRKKRIERNTAQKILYYIPDLLGDLKDIFSFDASLGPQIGFDLHATRAGNFSAFTGITAAIGTYPKQWLALRSEIGIDVAAGPIGLTAVTGEAASPFVSVSGSDAFVVHRPQNTLYQTYRDFWSFGGKVGLVIFGFSFEVHPMEAADAFTALYGDDLLADNLQATEDFRMTSEESALLVELNEFIGNGRLSAYRNDFPRLQYPRAIAAPDGDKKIRITNRTRGDTAKVMVLNFDNQTGSANYGYVSSSVAAAIYDSMKASFVFSGESPELNQKILDKQAIPPKIEIASYQNICERLGADYLILGDFQGGDKNAIAIRARVYGLQENKIILEISKTTRTDTSLFATTQQMSDDIVELMKKIR